MPGKLRLQNQRDHLPGIIGIGITILMILPYVLSSSEFAPVITAKEARTLPEFWSGGRTLFFTNDPWQFWFCGGRSGILPSEWCSLSWKPPQIFAGLLLPIVMVFPSRFPLVKQVTQAVWILPQILLASVSLFLTAHVVLFKLYLPSRYTEHSLRIIMAIAAGIALTIILDTVLGVCRQSQFLQRKIIVGLILFLGIPLLIYPSLLNEFPRANYRVGKPSLYEFFTQQPKDITIASLAKEADNIPTFSQRSVLISKEAAIPLMVGYYRIIRQRATDLIYAQYTSELVEVQQFIQKYGIDLWLLEPSALTPEYLINNSWLQQYQPVTTDAVARLQQGKTPALSRYISRCTIFETRGLVVLQADCLMKLPSE